MTKISKILNELSLQTDTTEIQDAIALFNKEITKLFVKDKESPYVVEASLDTSLGKSAQNITFRIRNISEADSKDRIKTANALCMTFLMFLTDNRGKVVKSYEIEPSLSWQYTERAKGVKAPVIKTKSVMDSTKQLIEWLKTNYNTIVSISKSDDILF